MAQKENNMIADSSDNLSLAWRTLIVGDYYLFLVNYGN